MYLNVPECTLRSRHILGMDFQGRLNQANGRLVSGKVGVKIEVKGNRLYLRATLPPKPDSPKRQPHQQRLALGYYANPAGISLAEAEARKVGALLDCKEFSWEPYLKASGQALTITHWIERLVIKPNSYHRYSRGVRPAGREG